MKRAAMIAAALTLILSLAACGNRDNDNTNNPPDQNNAVDNNGTDGRDDYDRYDRNDAGSSITGDGSTAGNGSTNGSGAANGSANNGGAANGSANNGGTVSGSDSSSTARSRVGDDLRRAADDVGDAVTGMVDDGRDALTRTTNTTTFQRMLDNARVHDTDGVLSDGENSRW